MDKKEKLECIIQLLSEQHRKAFKAYLKSKNLKKFYTAALASFIRHGGKINKLDLKKNSSQYCYNQLIESFYNFSLNELSDKSLLEVQSNILKQYSENPLIWDVRKQYAESLKTPQSVEDYHRSFEVNNASYFSSLDETKSTFESIERFSDAELHLDIYYAIQKLRLTLEKISRSYRLQTTSPSAILSKHSVNIAHINLTQHPLLAFYHALYTIIHTYHQQGNYLESLLEEAKQGLSSSRLEQEHKEFGLMTLINFFNTQRPSDFDAEIQQLYIIAHKQGLLFQKGDTIYFSDIANIISSCINTKDLPFLKITEEQYIPYAHHQECLNYLCKVAQLFLSKKWTALGEQLEQPSPLPPKEQRPYYLVQLHVIKIKAAVESYLEEMDYIYETEIDVLISSYLRLINRNTGQNLLPDYFKQKKLNLQKQITALVKTFGNISKKDQLRNTHDWYKKVPKDTLYYKWLTEIYQTLIDKLK
ncbi:hypothetical protein [Aureispira anguillae]|uniref:Uncharacterized protein n=1 Tax=Aureispira anguillae TaxID=2864201 RepID=A0A915YME5_9BACT|nr:hypothetical protein [Aureispira anguillae]BDS15709.1 hypothetical protein AsAng_0064930 [Aureispira anguillae]